MAISGINTFLWFETDALQAAEYYCALFPGAKILSIDYYPEGSGELSGLPLTVGFELFGTSFVAINGGPGHPHSDAVSFQIFCDTQDEIDLVWETLIRDGGEGGWCGWCKDRWGVSWQVIPRRLRELLGDPATAGTIFPLMRTIRKFDIDELNKAVGLS